MQNVPCIIQMSSVRTGGATMELRKASAEEHGDSIQWFQINLLLRAVVEDVLGRNRCRKPTAANELEALGEIPARRSNHRPWSRQPTCCSGQLPT